LLDGTSAAIGGWEATVQRINVYQMCRLAKLSYVAGAEIPKKYLEQ
jgi:hypothetical protein